MDEKEIIILASILIHLALVSTIIALFCAFVRKKNRLLFEKKEIEEALNSKLASTALSP